MDLPLLTGAAAIALASSLAFALVASGWELVSNGRRRPPAVAGVILNEAAQRICDQCNLAGRRFSTWLATALVFLIVFAALLVSQGRADLDSLPAWQLIVLLVLVSLAVGGAGYRFVQLVTRFRQLQLQRDAGMITGHALQKLNSQLNRTFHDVPCSAGIVDHVVVGLQGFYAVHVVARQPGRDNRVRLVNGNVQFASRHAPVSIEPFLAAARRLGRECSQIINHDIHVRCVVSVPGWEIGAQSSPDVLLANERNLSMLSGWKDQRDYLMNDDVATLHDHLVQRCSRGSLPG